jgi:ribosomal protein S18 acetylase RimI-like enzyme
MMVKHKQTIRRATRKDIPQIAVINSSGFQGNRADEAAALQWVQDHFNSGNLYHYYVVEREGKILAYIGWEIHGGYLRANPSVELEQLAVLPEYMDQKLGGVLIDTTMREMKNWVQARNNRIEGNIRFFVWGYFDNDRAHAVYRQHFPQAGGFRQQFGPRAEIMRYIDRAWSHSVSKPR